MLGASFVCLFRISIVVRESWPLLAVCVARACRLGGHVLHEKSTSEPDVSQISARSEPSFCQNTDHVKSNLSLFSMSVLQPG